VKVGDIVQVKQNDHAILRVGEEPQPVVMWRYATVLEELPDGVFVEIAHPGNIEHGARKKFARADVRTLDDVQALHDAHPARAVEKFDFNRHDHKEVNNLRAAIERMKPQEEAP
jgi:hypothetical protein